MTARGLLKFRNVIHKERHWNPYVCAVTTACGKWVNESVHKSWRGVTCKKCLGHKQR